MSAYTVRHSAPRQFEAAVGWDRTHHTYWFTTFDSTRPGPQQSRVANHGGDEEGDTIPTLAALLDRTWGFIRWDQERETLAKLADDPAREEREWHEHQRERFPNRRPQRAATDQKAQAISELLEHIGRRSA